MCIIMSLHSCNKTLLELFNYCTIIKIREGDCHVSVLSDCSGDDSVIKRNI